MKQLLAAKILVLGQRGGKGDDDSNRYRLPNDLVMMQAAANMADVSTPEGGKNGRYQRARRAVEMVGRSEWSATPTKLTAQTRKSREPVLNPREPRARGKRALRAALLGKKKTSSRRQGVVMVISLVVVINLVGIRGR
jgi:hypothetical protein